MGSNPSIWLNIPNIGDATSFYRGMEPWGELRQKRQVQFQISGTVDWSVASMCDVIFLQRPFTGDHLKVVELGRLTGKPVWVDYDDLLFNVPESNPAFGLYNQEKVKDTIIRIIKAATIVTVSTEALKSYLQLPKACLNERVYVIPNGIRDFWFKRGVSYTHKQHFNWRGTNTHDEDLETVSAELLDYAELNPKSTFSWIGHNPWRITSRMREKQAVVVPPVTIPDYWDLLYKSNPSIQICPLKLSKFNLSKSNIAWIEANLSGAVCIAPDWPEWRKPGVYTYRDAKDFRACLEFAATSAEENAKQVEQGREFIREHLLLSKLNVKRDVLLTALTAIARGADPESVLPMDGLPRKAAPQKQDDSVMELS